MTDNLIKHVVIQNLKEGGSKETMVSYFCSDIIKCYFVNWNQVYVVKYLTEVKIENVTGITLDIWLEI